MSHQYIHNELEMTRAKLRNFGMTSNVSGGVQVDINVVTNRLPNGRFSDAKLCDHNCRTITDGIETGHYDCPAAFTLNRGANIRTLAPANLLIHGIQNAAEGVRQFNKIFLESGFDDYSEKFDIKDPEQTVLKQALMSPNIEVNCFGGNPELHPKMN